MQVIYDSSKEVYLVKICDPETITWINSKDIVEARKIFIDHMTHMFNSAVCERLKLEQE